MHRTFASREALGRESSRAGSLQIDSDESRAGSSLFSHCEPGQSTCAHGPPRLAKMSRANPQKPASLYVSTVEAAAIKFWDEIAAESETKAKVVNIFKKYNEDMTKAGRPYRYG